MRAGAWFSFIAVVLAACGGPTGGADGGAADGGRLDAATIDASVAGDAGRSCERLSDCDDGRYCNGAEMCVDAVCVPGAPPCEAGTECLEEEDRCVTAECSTDALADADDDTHRSMACHGDDCDDGDNNRYPGNPEVCDTEGHDEDCDPETYGFRDADHDGYPDDRCCNGDVCGTDCDDMMPNINPGNPEVCGNGVDDNCNGMVDEGLLVDGYADSDGDGWGDDEMPVSGVCPGTPGFATMGGDCDEGDPAINPGAVEVCDTVDNDCDTSIDEGLPTIRCYRDGDGDGFGADYSHIDACGCSDPYVSTGGDCYDLDANVFPGQNRYFRSSYVTHPVGGPDVISWDYDCDGRGTPEPCGCGGPLTLCADRIVPSCPLSAMGCGAYVPASMCHADCSPSMSTGGTIRLGCR